MSLKILTGKFPNLPTDILDNVLLYLPYHNKILINKKNYSTSKKIFKKNINQIQIFYKKSINRIRDNNEYTNLNIDFEFLNKKDLQTYYILYYPNEYKLKFMKLTLNKIKPKKYIELQILYNNFLMNNNRKFYNFIRLLEINELFYIGW